jgi:sugar/nucleoside kinase (ribokinase family)
MMAGRILVVGDVVTDILAVHSGQVAVGSDTAARISITGGGSAANTAAWLARLGADVDLVAVAGIDVAGDDRLAELMASGVGCACVRRTAERPTGSIIVLVQDSERSFLCDRGANHGLAPSDVDFALASFDDIVHLHLSGYTLLDESTRAAGRHALAAAAVRGLTTSVDAASAAPLDRVGGQTFLEWVHGTDIVLANLDEAHALLDDKSASPDDLARGLATAARRLAVVKLAAAGAVWADGDGEVVRSEAAPAPVVVDSTGAGDAFAAGLLSAWLHGAEPQEALRAAARLGAESVGIVGGRPPPPSIMV